MISLDNINIKEVKKGMRFFRMGGSLPQSYVELHKQYALADVDRLLQKYDLTLIKSEMVNDGWMDGMKVLRLIVEQKNKGFKEIRWSDCNGGCWFEKTPSGGQSLMEIPENQPGRL
jgi:hypothetical protein